VDEFFGGRLFLNRIDYTGRLGIDPPLTKTEPARLPMKPLTFVGDADARFTLNRPLACSGGFNKHDMLVSALFGIRVV
jgi:hypothetical protein